MIALKTRGENFLLSAVTDCDVWYWVQILFVTFLLQEGDAEHACSQCKGSGSAPCSLCHGSKFSMLANRFRESYRALRCPACNESGVQPCQICAAWPELQQSTSTAPILCGELWIISSSSSLALTESFLKMRKAPNTRLTVMRTQHLCYQLFLLFVTHICPAF